MSCDPTTSMVERVARAIAAKTHPDDPYDDIVEEGRDYHRSVARAAVEAMLEPTAAMIAAYVYDMYEPDPRVQWQQMIQAALKDGSS